MKKLLLIRHAKAADETAEGDFVRPLKKSGTKDAQELAERLHDAGLIPQSAYTSPAMRAKTTAQIITDYLKIDTATPFNAIYEASEQTLLHIINDFPDEHNFIAMAGHNPGFSMLGTNLTGEYCSLPTCGAILISFNTDSWSMVSANTGKTEWVSEP